MHNLDPFVGLGNQFDLVFHVGKYLEIMNLLACQNLLRLPKVVQKVSW